MAETVLGPAATPQRAVRDGEGGGAGHISAGLGHRRGIGLQGGSQPAADAGPRLPRPVRPGPPEMSEGEDARNGPATLLLACAPTENGRPVPVPARRPAPDWAQFVRNLAAAPVPAKPSVLVLGHRNPPRAASRSAAFAPTEARRGRKRCAWHSTPTPGSGLHRAESESGARQGLRRCMPGGDPRRWAVHDPGCPDQAEVPLPVNPMILDCWARGRTTEIGSLRFPRSPERPGRN